MEIHEDKLWKKAKREQLKRLKPGECQKYVRLVLESAILSTPHGRHLLTELDESHGELNYELKQLPLRNLILWERNMAQLVIDPIADTALSEKWQMENHVLRILTSHELKSMIHQNTFYEYHEELRNLYPNCQHIVLYVKSNEKPIKSVTQTLLELQVIHNIRVIETVDKPRIIKEELMRLTKSIAEAPFKQQKSSVVDNFKKFLVNDKKQCVRVEGENGYRRLWQQHLNRLPLVTLEVAEVIIDKYASPKVLIDYMQTHTKEEFIKELADLRIKRCGSQAILTCDRRVGPVMAEKIYTLYNTKDPEATI